MQELIKVRGFQVAPAELEGHLLDHPDIADVCVIAAPDEYSGELPFAFVSLNEKVRHKVKKDAQEAARVRESIMKVRHLLSSYPCPPLSLRSLARLPTRKRTPRVDVTISQYVSDHKTQFKWLAGVEFIDVVPKNPSGKLLRRVLRDQLKQLLADGKIKLIQPGAKKPRSKL